MKRNPISSVYTHVKTIEKSDEYLMRTIQRGEVRNLGILFDRYQVDLFRFFLSKGHEYPESEDLVQLVFERIMKYKKSYRETSSFKAWLYAIARNISIDAFKKRTQPAEDLDTVDLISQENQSESMIHQETIRMAQKALELLTPEAREIIWLSWNSDMKYRDIGEMMGISEGAARLKVHRAIKKLKTTFKTLDR